MVVERRVEAADRTLTAPVAEEDRTLLGEGTTLLAPWSCGKS